MNELSLFTGIGGGLLGSKLLGWKTIGYVEVNDYCQEQLRQRIDDGLLDSAPIFTDVHEFIQSGSARQYKGFVDVVTGGFPCQPFSVAGKRAAEDDERNLWEATIAVIRTCEPEYCLLENVPGLLSAGIEGVADEAERLICGYFGTILRDVSESGYDAKWCVLGADDVYAPHPRKRLWLYLSNTKRAGLNAAALKRSHATNV